jgi:shikimate dehydrogenase
LDAGARSLRFRAEIPEQAAALARDLNEVRPGAVVDLAPNAHEEVQLLVNASPVGMHPQVDAMPVPAEWLRQGLAVFDVVYNPLTTRLLAAARQTGCLTIDGVGMFAEQAALQFELFTGAGAPREIMHRIVREALEAAAR